MSLQVVLFTISLLFELSSSSCPSEFHPMPVTSCPSIGCYRFQEQPDIFQQNRQEKRAFCSGQAINTYDGTGGLLEFRTLNEFNRVKEILQATRPSAPYLTSLMYSSAGTLQYVNGANVRQAADTVDTSLPVSSANATLQNKCVGIGVVGDSIDLIVVECDTPQAFICDLQLTAVPAPVLIGDNIRYVGPDNVITLRCTFGASNAIRSVVWLRNGVDITTVSSSGYTITASPTTFSELVFSAFDRTNHVGSYQCMVTGQLGNLRSKAVSVLSAGAPQIKNGPKDAAFPPGTIGFFSCFPDPSSVPHPTVTWYKDNTELVVPSDSTKFFVNPRSGRLFISNVGDSDVGNYHCRLENKEGSLTSSMAQLTLDNTEDLIPGYRLEPNFDVGNSTIKMLEGETLIVEVVAGSSHPSVNYIWTYPDGTTQLPTRKSALTYFYLNRGTNPSYFGNLELNNVNPLQSGLYVVLVSLIGTDPTMPDGELNAENNGEVSVLIQSVPAITALTASQTVELGKPFTITCSNTGNPDPNVVWFRNGVLLQNSADYVINGDDLMISNVQPRDLTSFQCLVNNEVGSSVDQLFICGGNGVPGLVMAEVEPFTTTSVRIRWDPPSQPNDDIELLDYDVYFDQRAISSAKSLDITGRQPDETRKWNDRSVIIDNLDFDDSVVAVVVARSPQGEGAQPQPDQATVGFTFGAAPTKAPENVVLTRLDGQRVNMSWDRVESNRNVDHDVTSYQIEYTLCTTKSVSEPVEVTTTTNSPSHVLNVPQDSSTQQVIMARVLAVTQVRREPDAFKYGPLSEYASEDGKPCPEIPPPFPTLAVVLGVLIPLIVIAVVIAIVVILLLAWWDRRNRGQYFPGKEEHGKTNLDRELNDNTNGLHGWEGSKEKAYYDDDDV